MNRKILIPLLLVLFAAAGGWWAQSRAPHEHELVRVTDAGGRVYYTCTMHSEVRQDEPGTCPICGMPLVRREAPAAAAPAAEESEREVLYWYDPMKPEVHFDAPGKSPFMDMGLVPKYAEAESDAGVVRIDPRMAQNLGIRTADVERSSFSQAVDTAGRVAVDERRLVSVQPRAAGWVEKLLVSAEGDPVEKGQTLAWLYAPELFAAAQELELARHSGDAALIEAARQRLRLLGGSAGAGSRTALTAPASGFVTALYAREGAQLQPGTPLMQIADLSQVWMLAEVPEAQAGWLAPGQTAQTRLRALPGETFEGRVDYVYPTVDARTRSIAVRLVFDNPEARLKPGMYARVRIDGPETTEALLVPSEAVIRTGTRSVVMLAEGQGRFRPAPVQVGDERGDRTLILSGLEPGQRVVVSGQFLIDSEASLRGAYRRLQGHAEGHSGNASTSGETR